VLTASRLIGTGEYINESRDTMAVQQ